MHDVHNNEAPSGILNLLKEKNKYLPLLPMQEHRLQEIFMFTVPIWNHINCLYFALEQSCGMK